MELTQTSNHAWWAPVTEAKQPPGSEPKTAQENTAAKQAPKETKAAVATTFGKVPAGDAKLPPAADPKAASPDGNDDPARQPDTYAKTSDGSYYIKYNENNNLVAVDGKENAVQDSKGRDYAVNDKGDFAKTADGKNYIVYDKTLGGKTVAVDDKGKTIDDGKGNAKVVNPDGNYAWTADGKQMVYPADSSGKIAALDRGKLFDGPQENVYLVKPDGQYAITSDGKYMAYGRGPDGKYVAIADNAVQADKQGHPYVLTEGGEYMQPEAGKFGVLNRDNRIVASDAATGEIVRDGNGNPFVLDKTGNYLQPEAGKFAVYNEQFRKTFSIDGKGNPVVDGNGNPYVVDDNGQYAKKADGSYDVYVPHKPGDYAKTPDGAYARTADGKFFIKYNENNNAVAIDDKNNVVRDSNGNSYALNDKGEFATTADEKKDYIVYHKTFGGNAVAIDYIGKSVADENGNPKVVKRDGTFARTVDGKEMVYAKDGGGKIAAVGAKQGDLFQGPQSKVYLVNSDGRYATTVDGKYMAYSTRGDMMAFGFDPDGQYVAVSGGKVFTDSRGHAYTVNADGRYMQPGPGQFGVLNKYNKIVASDAATGEVAKDVNGNAYTLDRNGKFMQPEPGKFAVYDEQIGKTIVNGDDGKIYLVGDDGKYAKKADGSYDMYVPKVAVTDLVPVNGPNQAQEKTPEGLSLYQDKSGKYVGVTNAGLIVEIDQENRRMVSDPATGMPVLLNDPFAERTRGIDNMSVMDTLSKLPQGAERGDPMVIKSELFKDGVLDKESLYAALGKYDPRDIYDALINSTKHGGWNSLPDLHFKTYYHPDEPMARTLIAGMIAWQNDNAPYAPIKDKNVPLLLAAPLTPGLLGAMDDAKISYINIATDGSTNLFEAAAAVYHELTHVATADGFKAAVEETFGRATSDRVYEVFTEYLANTWTQESGDATYDRGGVMEVMDDAMRKIGGGNIHAGTDLLRRAYLMGDPVAIKLVMNAVKSEWENKWDKKPL